MLTESSSVPMRQRDFNWACPLVSGPCGGKKTYLTVNGIKAAAFLSPQKEIWEAFPLQHIFLPNISPRVKLVWPYHFPTISQQPTKLPKSYSFLTYVKAPVDTTNDDRRGSQNSCSVG